MELKEFFNTLPKAALGFSGGVDSVYLLYAAVKSGAKVMPYFVKTPFQPRFELTDAKRAARDIGSELKIIEADHLNNEHIFENSENRCYFCKKFIFEIIKKQAAADGYKVLIDGTNASDSFDERPGMKAASELSVRSPLRECGLCKESIRELSKNAGLFTWNKPSYSCLATRIPAGTKITYELLEKIEGAENALYKMGFEDFRVRFFYGAAKLQFKKEQWEEVLKKGEIIAEEMEKYFDDVLLDLKGR